MAITAKIFLDTRRTKKDNTSQIKLRVTINRKSFEIASGYAIEAKYWDEKNSRVKSNCPSIQNTTRLNKFLQHKRSHALETILELEDAGKLKNLSLKEIKNCIKGNAEKGYIYAFAATYIRELEEMGKIGNAQVYQRVINSIRNFAGEKDFPLREITYAWLKKYEVWYLSRFNKYGRRNTINGLSINMRTLRALFNHATKRNLVSQDSYPFKKYTIQKEETRKRAISEQDIIKFKAVEPQTARQHRAKDYFLMSFYLMGASFIDLAFLKVGDIQAGRIEYKRRKTGRLHSIKITPPLQEILDKYLPRKKEEDFVLNVIPKDAPLKTQYARTREEMQRYNKALKDLAKFAGIKQSITSYTARHTFATLAKYKGIPVAAISEALGHADIKTTQIYLNQFDTDTMDAYHEMVIGGSK